MPLLRSGTSNKIATFNKHGLYLRWPRAWIIIIGIMLIFLCFCIAGMEIGNTLFDQYRATAFGGFIVFPPLLICAILILITGKFTYFSISQSILYIIFIFSLQATFNSSSYCYNILFSNDDLMFSINCL
jgi:hypothetical protein